MMIKLLKNVPKERKGKDIPINHHVNSPLNSMPRTLPPNDFVISYRGVLMSGKNSLNSFLKRAEKLIFHMVGKGQMALYFMRFVGR